MQAEERKSVNKPEDFASINLQSKVKQFLLYLSLMDIHPIVTASHIYWVFFHCKINLRYSSYLLETNFIVIKISYIHTHRHTLTNLATLTTL